MDDNKNKKHLGIHRVLLIFAFLFFIGVATFSATQIFLYLREDALSKSEYAKLREMYEPPEVVLTQQTPDDLSGQNDLPALTVTEDIDDTTEEAPANQDEPLSVQEPPTNPKPTPPPRDPAEVNADYIGWLKISGTVINYPVVKGEDNDKYLVTSFEGRRSGLGAVFMDYHCSGDFNDYHSIIYAHNVKNGTMFGSLYKYLDALYLEKNRLITITLPNGTVETWHIFAAHKSDTADPAYRVSFSSPQSFALFAQSLGAPQEISRLLTLSTCTTGGSNDERMLVHAAIF